MIPILDGEAEYLFFLRFNGVLFSFRVGPCRSKGEAIIHAQRTAANRRARVPGETSVVASEPGGTPCVYGIGIDLSEADAAAMERDNLARKRAASQPNPWDVDADNPSRVLHEPIGVG